MGGLCFGAMQGRLGESLGSSNHLMKFIARGTGVVLSRDKWLIDVQIAMKRTRRNHLFPQGGYIVMAYFCVRTSSDHRLFTEFTKI